MLRKYGALSLFLLLALCLLSCNNTNGNPSFPVPTTEHEGFTYELGVQIKKDFQMFTYGSYDGWEALSIPHYFGYFGGCEIVYINGLDMLYEPAYVPVEIAGYTIVFSSNKPLYAYKNSNFYTIKEAYDAGIITREDVYAIGNMMSVHPL
ncbi:MAG: hypothetical protein FWF98_05205 [Dehalococcoidia bacterium]|nr:hypothetical protein [Dehalococcoidia bacterium]